MDRNHVAEVFSKAQLLAYIFLECVSTKLVW